MMSYEDKMSLFFKAVVINGANALGHRAQVDEEGQLVASGGWLIGAWFANQKKMSLFFKAVAINGTNVLVHRAQVDEEGQLVASDGWPIGAWFNYQKQNLKNPAKKAAVYAMLTQDGTNEIVKAKLDKFLASMH